MRRVEGELPEGFFELSARIAASETASGAARVDPPQQQVVRPTTGHTASVPADSEVEAANAALSLAANLAIADVLYAHDTGLFRVMADPDQRAGSTHRQTARRIGVDWPKAESLEQRERRLDPNVATTRR